MTDKPLFQNVDDEDTGTDPSDLAMEGAAIGLAAGAVGPGSGTNPSAPGPAAGVGPAVGATALANELYKDDDDQAPID